MTFTRKGNVIQLFKSCYTCVCFIYNLVHKGKIKREGERERERDREKERERERERKRES